MTTLIIVLWYSAGMLGVYLGIKSMQADDYRGFKPEVFLHLTRGEALQICILGVGGLFSLLFGFLFGLMTGTFWRIIDRKFNLGDWLDETAVNLNKKEDRNK